MTPKFKAIYTGGVFRPTLDLALQDQQRVRVTVETIDGPVSSATAIASSRH